MRRHATELRSDIPPADVAPGTEGMDRTQAERTYAIKRAVSIVTTVKRRHRRRDLARIAWRSELARRIAAPQEEDLVPLDEAMPED
jgi:hypothetical protein